jgi:hypothetical protein
VNVKNIVFFDMTPCSTNVSEEPNVSIYMIQEEMEAAGFSEMLVPMYLNTRRHIPKDGFLNYKPGRQAGPFTYPFVSWSLFCENYLKTTALSPCIEPYFTRCASLCSEAPDSKYDHLPCLFQHLYYFLMVTAAVCATPGNKFVGIEELVIQKHGSDSNTSSLCIVDSLNVICLPDCNVA